MKIINKPKKTTYLMYNIREISSEDIHQAQQEMINVYKLFLFSSAVNVSNVGSDNKIIKLFTYWVHDQKYLVQYPEN